MIELASFTAGLSVSNWNQLSGAQRVVLSSSALTEFARNSFHVATSTVLKNGDKCVIGDWVVWADGGHANAIGKVVNLMTPHGSEAYKAMKIDYALLEATQLDLTGSNAYRMPRIHCLEEVKIVSVSQILCITNVQHNCAAHRCQLTKQVAVVQEREASTKYANRLHHEHPEDLMLNMAQMRSASFRSQFHISPPPLVPQQAIEEGARFAIDRRKKLQSIGKGKQTNRAPPSRPQPTSITVPSQRSLFVPQQPQNLDHSLPRPLHVPYSYPSYQHPSLFVPQQHHGHPSPQMLPYSHHFPQSPSPYMNSVSPFANTFSNPKSESLQHSHGPLQYDQDLDASLRTPTPHQTQ